MHTFMQVVVHVLNVYHWKNIVEQKCNEIGRFIMYSFQEQIDQKKQIGLLEEEEERSNKKLTLWEKLASWRRELDTYYGR